MHTNELPFPSKNRGPKNVSFFDDKVRTKSRINTKSTMLTSMQEKTLGHNPNHMVKLPKIIKADRTPQKIRISSNEKLKIIQLPEEKLKIQRQKSGEGLNLCSLKNLYIDSRKNLSRVDSSFVLPQGHSSPAIRGEKIGLGYSKLVRRYSNPRQRNNIMEYSSHSFMITSYK